MKVSNVTVRSTQTSPISVACLLEDGGDLRTTNQMKAPIQTEPLNVES